MAGDGRFRYVYAREGRGQGARGRRRPTLLGAHAWVRTRAQVLDDGWIGTRRDRERAGPHRRRRARVARRFRVRRSRAAGRGTAAVGPRQPHARRDVRPARRRRGSGVTRTDVQVRGFRPDEWELLRELRLRALSQDPDAFVRRTRERSSSPTKSGASARATPGSQRATARRAGIVSAVPVDGDGAELVAMWVARDFRGRGVGDALVAWVVAEARRAGARLRSSRVRARKRRRGASLRTLRVRRDR